MDWSPTAVSSAAPTQAQSDVEMVVAQSLSEEVNRTHQEVPADEVRFIEFFAGEGA